MNFQIIPWNGDPPYPPATWNDLQVAIQSGDTITIDGTIEQPISIAGGYLLRGCPLNVLLGAPLTLAQASVLVQNAAGVPSIRNGACYTQAQALVANSGTTGKGPSVSNTPAGSPPPTNGGAPGQIPATVYTQGAVASATGPSTTGGLPSGPSSAVGGVMLSQVYRFILQVQGGYATGANRQGCSQTNSAMCDPEYFPDPGGLQAAIDYAIANGEIPYKVDTATDSWNLMSGAMQIDPSRIYNRDGSLGSSVNLFGIPLWMLVAAGVAVYFITK